MNDRIEWAKGVRTTTRLLVLLGFGGVTLFLAAFGAWAGLAPISGAVVVPGVVIAAGQNQIIQHLEGGIIQEILVREGDRVSAGDPLFKLDPTAARAHKDQLVKQLVALNAQAERLVAERDGKDAVTFPESLKTLAEQHGMSRLLDEQLTEFSTRRARHEQEKFIMGQRIQALEEQIQGMTAQQTALERQIEVVNSETERKKTLLDKGLTNRSEYSALLRSEADLLGQLGQAKSTILAAKTQIVEATEQLARLDTQRIEKAVTDLTDIRVKISDAQQQLIAAEAVLERKVVRAPGDGVVVSVAHNTPGGVVRPGEQMLQLLPTGRDLVVEARLAPQDVDAVSLGQNARLQLTALNTRSTPIVEGIVTYLSADRIMDPATNTPFYTARLRLAEQLPAEVDRDDIYPGMPVEVFFKTGERTFLEYLTKPISDSFSRAFREQ